MTRARTLEKWWAGQTGTESSSASSTQESDIQGDESPHHLRHKLRVLNQTDDQFDQGSLPASQSSTQAPGNCEAPFDIRRFLQDEEKEFQDIIAGSVPFFSEKQRSFKFGGCPHHSTLSLQPHVPKSGHQRGQLLLRCSHFWKRGEDGKPLCWFQYPFPMKLWKHLSKTVQDQFVDLENSLQRNAVKQ